MTLIEFIGFVVSLLMMLFLFVKSSMDNRRKQRDPERFLREEAEKEERLRRLLDPTFEKNKRRQLLQAAFSQDEDEEEEELIQPVPKTAIQKRLDSQKAQNFAEARQLKAVIEKRQMQRAVKDESSQPYQLKEDVWKESSQDPYALKKAKAGSRIHSLIQNLKSPKEMAILFEVMGKPKAFRSDSDR